MSPERYQTCNSYCISWLLIFLLEREDQLYCVVYLFDSYFHKLRGIFAENILWSEDTPSKEKYASQLKDLFIHFLFMGVSSWCNG